MITIEENESILQNILEGANKSDVAMVTENLQKLRDNFNTDFTDYTTISNKNEELNSSNEKLRQCNMDLFLKIPKSNTDDKKDILDNKGQLDNNNEDESILENVIKDIGGFN